MTTIPQDEYDDSQRAGLRHTEDFLENEGVGPDFVATGPSGAIAAPAGDAYGAPNDDPSSVPTGLDPAERDDLYAGRFEGQEAHEAQRAHEAHESVGEKLHEAVEDLGGKIKEGWGRLTGNESLEAEGRAQQADDDPTGRRFDR